MGRSGKLNAYEYSDKGNNLSMYIFRRLFFSALLTTVGAIMATAQTETGQITGTVIDATSAAISGAAVTATLLSTQAIRSTTTSEAGTFTIPNLLPGEYQVAVTSPGFNKLQQRVTVNVGSKVGLDLKLEVGSTSTVVEVSETAAQVNIASQTLSTVISGREVLEFPTLTRNPYALVAAAGNVSETDPSGRGAGFAINGQRASSTNILLDGVPNNDEFAGQVGQPVPLDSVAEFSVLTTNFSAEYGRASGGIVNVVTKSGSNALHGTAYEFNRVSRYASNSYDNNANGIDKPVFDRNQFGFSVGGAIIKNKLFFFENTEWIRVRSQATQFSYIPTPQLLAASAPATQAFFSQFGQLRSNLATISTLNRTQFPFCKGSAATGGCLSLPAGMPLFSRVAYNVPSDSGGGNPQDTHELVGRIDYNLSEKTQLYGRYALYNANQFVGTNVNSPYQGFDSGFTNVDNAVVLSATHTFSPQFVSQSKIDFNRLNNQQPLGARPPSPTLFINSSATSSITGVNIALPGYGPSSPGNAIPFGGPQNLIVYNQDLSYTAGVHTFRFGGAYTYIRDNRTFGAYQEAVEGLGNSLGNGIDNLVAGQLRTFQAAINPQGKYPCGAVVNAACTVTLPVGPPNFSRSNRYHEFAYSAAAASGGACFIPPGCKPFGLAASPAPRSSRDLRNHSA